MAKIRSYTTIEQSRKLAGILPLESADMGWNVFVDETTRILPIDDWDLVKDGNGNVKFYHAWSLAALLGVLPKLHKLQHSENGYYCSLANYKYVTEAYNNPIDACVEMIIKLHELNLL